MSELLPCPFCGCAPTVEIKRIHDIIVSVYVECNNEKCPALLAQATGITMDYATEKWNTRADVKQKWISVDERLPEKYETVFVKSDNGYQVFGFYSEDETWIEFEGIAFDLNGLTITHWCPIEFPED